MTWARPYVTADTRDDGTPVIRIYDHRDYLLCELPPDQAAELAEELGNLAADTRA